MIHSRTSAQLAAQGHSKLGAAVMQSSVHDSLKTSACTAAARLGKATSHSHDSKSSYPQHLTVCYAVECMIYSITSAFMQFCMIQKRGVSLFTGLDHWTGPLDWTTGLDWPLNPNLTTKPIDSVPQIVVMISDKLTYTLN